MLVPRSRHEPRSGRANSRDFAYSVSVKTIFLVSATFAFCGFLSGCRSNTGVTTDAARGDAADEHDGLRADTAPDEPRARADTAPQPEDASSPLEVSPTSMDLAADAPPSEVHDNDHPTPDAPNADLPTPDTRNMDVLSGADGCNGWTTLKRVSPAEAADLIATADPIVINVHIPYAGDIPGTDTSIPFNNVDAIEAYLNGDHCAEVLLVCLSGGMSQSAGNELVNRGYLRVRDINGGMEAWEAAGYGLLRDGGP